MTSTETKIQKLHTFVMWKLCIIMNTYPFPHLWEDKGSTQPYLTATVNTSKQDSARLKFIKSISVTYRHCMLSSYSKMFT